MKIFMPILLVLVGLLVVGGVIFLKRGTPAAVTSRGMSTQETSKETSGSIGIQSVKSSGAVISPAPTKRAAVPGILLSITSPANGVTVKSSTLLVKGVTAPGADVSVNETDVVSDTKGNFSASITLDEGENSIFIFVIDRDGNYTEQEMTVTYDTGVTYQ